MGRRGPHPKPNALRQLAGQPLKPNTPIPQAGVPTCPNWLKGEAKSEWRRVVAELVAIPDLLTLVDRSVLASYCQHYARWREAERAIDKDGSIIDIIGKHGEVVAKQPSPWVGISHKECELMTKAGDRLGLNPSSRSSIHLPSKQKHSNDPLKPPKTDVPLRPPQMRVEKL